MQTFIQSTILLFLNRVQSFNNNNKCRRNLPPPKKKISNLILEVKKEKKKTKIFLLNNQQFCSKKQQWKSTVSSNVMHYVLKNNLHHWLMQSRCNNVATLYQLDTKVKKENRVRFRIKRTCFEVTESIEQLMKQYLRWSRKLFFLSFLAAALLTFNAQVCETNSSQVW